MTMLKTICSFPLLPCLEYQKINHYAFLTIITYNKQIYSLPYREKYTSSSSYFSLNPVICGKVTTLGSSELPTHCQFHQVVVASIKSYLFHHLIQKLFQWLSFLVFPSILASIKIAVQFLCLICSTPLLYSLVCGFFRFLYFRSIV